jgi:conjugative relaxase-like TrwC/TraI family protein
VTVSMRVMSAGDGYKYLLRTVAAGDGQRSLSTPLTRYYSAKGTPPGRWMGSGLPGLGSGRILEGAEVTEAQLQRLIGLGRDPINGAQLGRAYPEYQRPTERASPGSAQEIVARRRAVAGYDFTFSIPKSASILWGVSDAATQSLIVQSHHVAVSEVVAYMEREVAATRTGTTAYDGAVAQVDVTGLIATAFDHFDSRAGDPHLHTHVVISNKVRTVLDGKWRSLDGRPMHAAVVALSELHESLFADALTRSLGVRWEMRERGRDRHPALTISSVPETLVAEFSSRSDVLIDAYLSRHGRRPSPVTIMKLRAQATLSTRPAKEVRSLAELTAEWRERAERVRGEDATTWAPTAVGNAPASVWHAEDLPPEAIDAVGLRVMTSVSEKRATWRYWNLAAEAARQLAQQRYASASDREAVIGLVVDAAERASLRITPPELAPSPDSFRRADGTSVFRPKHATVFTSTELLDAESRLLKRAGDTTGPRVAPATLRAISLKRLPDGVVLADDQLAALTSITVSGRAVDVLVGPAGAGKTTAMNVLRHAWEATHQAGSVVGLAPSAAAAQVLAEDLGIPTENLAKWWQNHLDHGVTFHTGQLVIVDEASLAGTLSLDRITALAASAGAKMLLVGDHAQLQSVDAGGAFSMLVHSRADAPELVEVHRFTHEWEKTASLGLRQGDPDSIDRYIAHDRVSGGDTESMMDAAYTAWRADTRAGRATVLITDSNEEVASLNARARTELILEGRIDAVREVSLHDGSRAAVGDTVITRRNDRRLRSSRTWVRNGDRWTVAGVRHNGSVDVRRHGHRWGSAVRRQGLLGARLRRHLAPGARHNDRHRSRRRNCWHDTGEPLCGNDARPRREHSLRRRRPTRCCPRRAAIERRQGCDGSQRPLRRSAARRRGTVRARNDRGAAGCLGFRCATRGRIRDHRSGRAARQVGGIGTRQRALIWPGRPGHRVAGVRELDGGATASRSTPSRCREPDRPRRCSARVRRRPGRGGRPLLPGSNGRRSVRQRGSLAQNAEHDRGPHPQSKRSDGHGDAPGPRRAQRPDRSPSKRGPRQSAT